MQEDIPEYMKPNLSPYGKTIWRDVLAMLDGESLSPTDYVMLEALCLEAENLRGLNEQMKKQPFLIVDGMVKANPLTWNVQSSIKSISMLSDKLGINRAMRTQGKDNVPKELLAFMRGTPNAVPSRL